MKGSNTMVLVALTTLTLGAVFTVPTLAQNRPCAADAQKFCSQVEPGNRQALAQCLRDHASELSDACKDRIQGMGARGGATRGALRDACANDVQTFCGNVEPGGGGIGQCLKEHRTELSQECKAALAEARSNR